MALLLEDLDVSPLWRLATERDVEDREVGRAVAEWYQFLHIAGRSLVKRGAPSWLQWEWDMLSVEELLQVGEKLELEDAPVWRMAAYYLYHLLGIGLAWSDVRNVTHSLGPAAQEAFLDAYGPTHPEEEILDDPLSVLHALHVATTRPSLPRWAMPYVEESPLGAPL